MTSDHDPELPSPPLPPRFVVRFVLRCIEALSRLVDRLLPPIAVMRAASGVARTQWIGVFCELGLPELLAQGPLPAADLARRCEAHEQSLTRLLEALRTLGYVRRGARGYTLGPLGHLLRKDHPGSLRDFALYWASGSNVRAWSSFGWSVRTGQSAFRHAHGEDVWTWFESHDGERETFARMMSTITRMEAGSVASLPIWDGAGTLVDLAGGRGVLLAEILRRHPDLRGVLVDSERVLQLAPPVLQSRGVDARITLRPGDLFAPPLEGVDGVLLKHILHDWDDARCTALLTTVRAGLREGAKLYVIDAVVPESGVDEGLALSDLQMLVACEQGQERTIAGFRALLVAAGFSLLSVHPTPAMSSVLVAEAV